MFPATDIQEAPGWTTESDDRRASCLNNASHLLSPTRRRAAIRRLLSAFDISDRMACRLVGLSRSAWLRPLHSEATADPDAALRVRLGALAKGQPRHR